MRRFELQRVANKHSTRPSHRKSSLAQLIPYPSKCFADPASLSGRDVGRIRLLLARYAAKRGLPDSARCRLVREKQAGQTKTPLYQNIAATVIARLQPYPENEGIEDLTPVTKALTEEEAFVCKQKPGRALPETLRRKINRCLSESIEVLVERGLITSSDVLAKVLPQLTSGLRAAGIADPLLRPLYAATYRAFRQRRSLLLLNLQSQVRIEELPWVAAIEMFRSDNLSTQDLARQTLEEITYLTLVSFPHAILPNKLLQELRALVQAAALDIPLVEELAADIFMGKFSDKFVHAAKQAAEVVRGTLYESYYGIDYGAVGRLRTDENMNPWFWSFRSSPLLNDFPKLCSARAGVTETCGAPATNGVIIEQQQIVTTQNLAPLLAGLGLQKTLRPHLADMARRCFEWICDRLQIKQADGHARLITLKNTAYAWRQMLIYLSFVSADELGAFIVCAEDHLSEQALEFQARFRPVFAGLRAASKGKTTPQAHATSGNGRQFLGWSDSRHWLLS